MGRRLEFEESQLLKDILELPTFSAEKKTEITFCHLFDNHCAPFKKGLKVTKLII